MFDVPREPKAREAFLASLACAADAALVRSTERQPDRCSEATRRTRRLMVPHDLSLVPINHSTSASLLRVTPSNPSMSGAFTSLVPFAVMFDVMLLCDGDSGFGLIDAAKHRLSGCCVSVILHIKDCVDGNKRHFYKHGILPIRVADFRGTDAITAEELVKCAEMALEARR